jgi:hypothetical protein
LFTTIVFLIAYFNKLEQTGSVIMQTLAGLALDTGLSGNDTPDDPSQRGLAAIQYLLNAFLVLNIFQLLALIALAHLDRRRKAVAVSGESVHRSLGNVPDEFDEIEIPGLPKSSQYADVNQGAEGSIHLPLSAREELFSSATSLEQSIPLLVSDTERSYFARDPVNPNPIAQIPRSHPTKSKQARRGELFAGLSAMLVVFAWVLFLVTAWVRLRSKAERGGTATTH